MASLIRSLSILPFVFAPLACAPNPSAPQTALGPEHAGTAAGAVSSSAEGGPSDMGDPVTNLTIAPFPDTCLSIGPGTDQTDIDNDGVPLARVILINGCEDPRGADGRIIVNGSAAIIDPDDAANNPANVLKTLDAAGSGRNGADDEIGTVNFQHYAERDFRAGDGAFTLQYAGFIESDDLRPGAVPASSSFANNFAYEYVPDSAWAPNMPFVPGDVVMLGQVAMVLDEFSFAANIETTTTLHLDPACATSHYDAGEITVTLGDSVEGHGVVVLTWNGCGPPTATFNGNPLSMQGEDLLPGFAL